MKFKIHKLLWTVVQFKQDGEEENHEVSVVPLKWLIKKEDGIYCYWPSSNKARKYIKKASEPNSTWRQYPCPIKMPLIMKKK
nr:unnamed protein product [Callosobruchus analis]